MKKIITYILITIIILFIFDALNLFDKWLNVQMQKNSIESNCSRVSLDYEKKVFDCIK